MDNFPHGDQALVGEKGLMLSGGQKVRLSLARAIYREADMYILDDPFSALDKRVAKQVLNLCILGYLKGKTVILVTHQTQFLLHADVVYNLENSRCVQVAKDDISSFDTEERNDMPINMQDTRDTDEETSKKGLSGFSTYLDYFKSGSLRLFAFSLLLFVLMFYMKILMDQTISQFASKKWDNGILIALITITGLIIVLETGRQFSYHINISLCSINLHNNMFFKVMSAPMRFFNVNPKGRILNRFSRDLGFIDSLVHLYLEFLIIVPGGMLMSIGLAMSSVFLVLVPTLVAIAALGYVTLKVTVYGSELKRIEAVRANPIYELLDNALRGVVSIRCFKKKKHFLKKMYYALNNHAMSYHFLQSYYIITENLYFIIAVILQLLTNTLCVLMSKSSKAFLIGLAISYITNFIASLDYCLSMFTYFDGVVSNLFKLSIHTVYIITFRYLHYFR